VSDPVELYPPAKLNLFLEVLGRRPDGFHEIDTVVQAIGLRDTLRLERADSVSLAVEGDAPADATNLVWRAADALGVGATMRLTKRIPSGAGLGGGSSDAAAALRGLAALHGLALPEADLRERAARLGSDVPFFLSGGLARCRGRGERVDPIPEAPPASFLVACPALVSLTARVYAALPSGLTGDTALASLFLEQYSSDGGPRRAPYFNRLQPAAEALSPRLRDVREALVRGYGRPFTMTGSGAAYFAVAERGDPAESRMEVAGVRVIVRKVEAVGP